MSDQMRLANQWNWSTVIFYLWHLTDGLTHLLIESTYVYGCFRNSVPMDEFVLPHQSSCACACASSSFSNSTNSFRPFLGRKDRLHGNEYGTSVFAKLWQEYARADGRYAGVDLTTLSLEIVTVVLAGPLALYVAELGRRDVRSCGHIAGNTCFWATVLAVSELYGGLINFLPEWLSGNSSLRTDDPLYFWIYIVLFNAIWVLFPLWVLRQVYSNFWTSFVIKESIGKGNFAEDRKLGKAE